MLNTSNQVGTPDTCLPANTLQLLLLRSRWHIILIGLAFQYVHGIFTQLAYRMHQPAAQPLHDVGFQLIPVSSSSSSSSSTDSCQEPKCTGP
jgi:hypothetical protein